MQNGVLAQQRLQAIIKTDIAARTAVHQARLAQLRAGEAALRAITPSVAPPAQPLVLLANGDSWFDYPLTGNGLPIENTDIIAQLKHMGRINPIPLSVAHHGDATTNELSLPKQQRMLKALQDPANWGPGGKPDAILFSGGGNDIAGEQFCIFLDNFGSTSAGLNQARFRSMLGMVEASYGDLFAFRDRYAAGVPIYAHCYDFPIPNGKHPICAGPWLQPSFDFMGWTQIGDRICIVTDALTQFAQMLGRLASNPANKFTLVRTQGTFQSSDWANELHPYPPGFVKMADLFVTALRKDFPNRI